MKTVTVADVTAAIDEARARHPGGVVAFDGDGTLWSGDIGDEYFDALLEHGVHGIAHDALVREARTQNIDASGTARDVGRRIHRAYFAGMFPEDRLCELIARAAAGWRRSDLEGFCSDLVEKLGLRSRLHPEALHVVEHARRVGVDVFVVSASPRAIVEQAVKVAGIEPSHAVAVCERFDGDVVVCDVHRPIPYRDGKVTQLRERIGGERVLYAAFGDNAFDVEMLRAAQRAFAVRPKKRLLERAAEVPGVAVLDRLNAHGSLV